MMTFREIGQQLGIKEQTAYAHYRSGLRKLACRFAIHDIRGLQKLLQSERDARVKEGQDELAAYHR